MGIDYNLKTINLANPRHDMIRPQHLPLKLPKVHNRILTVSMPMAKYDHVLQCIILPGDQRKARQVNIGNLKSNIVNKYRCSVVK